jgi:hypothetical protein
MAEHCPDYLDGRHVFDEHGQCYGINCKALVKLKRPMTDPYLPSHVINADKKVAVSTDVYWQPIATCPRGVKVQLLGAGGVATYGTYYGDKFWSHWCPLPKKPKEDS